MSVNSPQSDDTPELHVASQPETTPDPIITSSPSELPALAQPENIGTTAESSTPLHWSDLLYIVLFYGVCGAVLYLGVTAIAMVAFGISPDALRDSMGVRASVLIVTQTLLSGATLAFLYVLVRGRTSQPFWPTVGWHAFSRMGPRASMAIRYALGGSALAIVVGMIGSRLNTPTELPIEQLFHSRQSVLLLTAMGILVAPFAEETLFRGCLYPVIARKFGIPVGIVLTGTLFGMAHAQQLGGAWGQVSLLVCVGIILTYVRARAGTVAASYFVHLGYNTFIFAGYYLYLFLFQGGLHHLPGS